ncbi:Fumarate hydratase class II [Listeria grayi]|uniref:Fumarate hydratase class II n=1 Tax=Listeria grayi TaxID=1641 RepID=A0A378MCP1_LISGR|nr:Fumarate hydratase class II [Listeria grayi]
MMTRIEHDSIGEIEVDDDKFWGAQTERSRRNFKFTDEQMPEPIIQAFLELKKLPRKLIIKKADLLLKKLKQSNELLILFVRKM